MPCWGRQQGPRAPCPSLSLALLPPSSAPPSAPPPPITHQQGDLPGLRTLLQYVRSNSESLLTKPWITCKSLAPPLNEEELLAVLVNQHNDKGQVTNACPAPLLLPASLPTHPCSCLLPPAFLLLKSARPWTCVLLQTPLMYAAFYKKPEIVRLLLSVVSHVFNVDMNMFIVGPGYIYCTVHYYIK